MESWILRVSCKVDVKPKGLHLFCKRPEVFMIPWTLQKLNSFLNLHYMNFQSLYELQVTIWTSSFQPMQWCNILCDMDSSCRWKTVLILISWLHQKPADQDQHCFQNNSIKVWKSYSHHEYSCFEKLTTKSSGMNLRCQKQKHEIGTL